MLNDKIRCWLAKSITVPCKPVYI